MANNNIIEIFKTDIHHPALADMVIGSLRNVWPDWKINVDLDDCDNILRIASSNEVDVQWVRNHLATLGYKAELLN